MHITLDFVCYECLATEERFLKKEDVNSQVCTNCGTIMSQIMSAPSGYVKGSQNRVIQNGKTKY